MRWPIVLAWCARTVRRKPCAPAKLPALYRFGAGEGFLVEVGGGGASGIHWSAIPPGARLTCASGYVSVKAAQRGYGVVIRVDGRRFELDLEATAALRKSALTTKIA